MDQIKEYLGKHWPNISKLLIILLKINVLGLFFLTGLIAEVGFKYLPLIDKANLLSITSFYLTLFSTFFIYLFYGIKSSIPSGRGNTLKVLSRINAETIIAGVIVFVASSFIVFVILFYSGLNAFNNPLSVMTINTAFVAIPLIGGLIIYHYYYNKLSSRFLGLEEQKFKTPVDIIKHFFIKILPMLLIILFFCLGTSVVRIKKYSQPAFQATIRINNKVHYIDINLLLPALEGWIVANKSTHTIDYIPHHSIIYISSKAPSESWKKKEKIFNEKNTIFYWVIVKIRKLINLIRKTND